MLFSLPPKIRMEVGKGQPKCLNQLVKIVVKSIGPISGQISGQINWSDQLVKTVKSVVKSLGQWPTKAVKPIVLGRDDKTERQRQRWFGRNTPREREIGERERSERER
jgi:hypothetical protein